MLTFGFHRGVFDASMLELVARVRPAAADRAVARVASGGSLDGYEHTVTSHINRLRTKIEDDPREPRRIVTVWGVGYRFDDSSA
ncbi:MAG: Transcriptional regulatory protein OmpR [Candidatus Accumulibacter sp. SK-11]|nr:MAG: Transcriptional regulatory protein OmpR [Candidatus Accumulibacter sp. SK-11]